MVTATNFKFTLDKSSRKFECPQCKKKSFVWYKDVEGAYQSPEFGRCDREVNCGYINYPSSDIEAEITYKTPIVKPQIFFPKEIFERTLSGYGLNTFLNNLKEIGITEEAINNAVTHFKLGTLTKGKFAGAVTFPFIDKYHRVHSVQVKTFDRFNKTKDQSWLHSVLYHHYKPNGNIPQWIVDYYGNDIKTKCFFGEHALETNTRKEIIIAESPKNAILGSFFLPEYLWMASGSLRTLSVDKLRKLKGRKILLIPDTSTDSVAFSEWEYIMEDAKSAGIDVRMFSFLEDNTTEEQKAKGYDIADYITDLLKADPNLFRTAEKQTPATLAPEPKKQHTQAERVNVGMMFSTDGLQELAKKMIAENDSQTEKEMTDLLFQIEGLTVPDATDLLMVMRMKNLIDVTNQNRYFLSHSTPF